MRLRKCRVGCEVAKGWLLAYYIGWKNINQATIFAQKQRLWVSFAAAQLYSPSVFLYPLVVIFTLHPALRAECYRTWNVHTRPANVERLSHILGVNRIPGWEINTCKSPLKHSVRSTEPWLYWIRTRFLIYLVFIGNYAILNKLVTSLYFLLPLK